MKNKIFLRGRHLSNLANQYFESEDPYRIVYPRKELYDRIIENPELAVEIVEGLDSVCEQTGAEECPGFESDCVFPNAFWDEDRETLKEYDLQVGRTYVASDILERIIDYKNNSRFANPRTKFLVERGRR